MPGNASSGFDSKNTFCRDVAGGAHFLDCLRRAGRPDLGKLPGQFRLAAPSQDGASALDGREVFGVFHNGGLQLAHYNRSLQLTTINDNPYLQ